MSKNYSRDNLDFLLNEVFDVEALLHFEKYRKFNRKKFKKLLDNAHRISEKELASFSEEIDKEPPVLVGNEIRVHAQLKKMLRKLGDEGWMSSCVSLSSGGQYLPVTLSLCTQFIFSVANNSASVYSFSSLLLASAIDIYGSDDVKKQFLPNVNNGTWQGVIAIPYQFGSNTFKDVTSSAKMLTDESGVYLIKGASKHVSCGFHSGVDNALYLFLARIDGDPLGEKGLSAFLVSHQRPTGTSKVDNDLIINELYDKMGCTGVPSVSLLFGEEDQCFGHLIGQRGQGLEIIQYVSNLSRMGVGIRAAADVSSAYYKSLDYASDKTTTISDSREAERVTTLDSDVKRMLISQKAILEGSLSLLIQCAYYLDLVRAGKEEVKEIYQLTLELLIPVVKAYPSEEGVSSVSNAMQIFGELGYSKSESIEKHYRDIKYHSLTEVTTSALALELLGKKIVMGGGIAFRVFTEEVSKTINRARLDVTELSSYGEKLNDVLFRLQNTTMKLSTLAMKERKEVYLMDATAYLELFALVAIGWQWLLQAIPAQIAVNESRSTDFYDSKLMTMKYYFEYELPKAESLIQRLNSTDKLLLKIKPNHLV